VRVEQLAPFQRTAISEVIGQYPNLTEIVWAQEEPRNMGAWTFMESRLRDMVGTGIPIRYVGRPNRASPAEGSADMHAAEQRRIVATTLVVPEPASNGRLANGRHNGRRVETRTPASVGDE